MNKRSIMLASVLVFLLVLCTFSGVALAADYLLENGLSLDISQCAPGSTVTIDVGANVTITGSNTNIQIICYAGANLTLNGVTINNTGTDSCPLTFTGSGDKLILAPGTTNTLTAGDNEPAVCAEDTTELTISGSGTLNAKGGLKSAGIGGGQGSSAGTINITGGTVKATAGGNGAGIGGGNGGSGGTIEISGGAVTATGGGNSAGIGGGNDGYCGSITISGNADVTAKGSTYGAGIGSGYNSSGNFNNVCTSAIGTITITGGTVHATGGYCSAAIGGGRFNSIGTISIQGGSIYAEGGNSGAGVGSCGGGGVVNISGGTVNAWGDIDGAGIGGNNDELGDSIVSVSISGGTVFATGGENAAGLGSGYGSRGSAPAISISGGKVYASRGASAVYDIGTGLNNTEGESLTVSGDAAVFMRNDSSVTPVITTTHTHMTDNKSYGIVMPDDWTTFGAWLRLCTLSYNTNGGSSTAPGSVNQQAGTTVSVGNTGSYMKMGYTQGSGWNTKVDGSGTDFAAGSTFTFNKDTTLYAKWTANTYTVKYDANGGTGSMADSGFTYDASSNLRTNSFTRTNYAFAGWAASADGGAVYTDGQSVKNLTASAGGTVTLYAKWTENTYTVKYDANGGTGTMADSTLIYDASSNLRTNSFTCTNYAFAGWAASADSGAVYTDGQSVKNLTDSAGGTVTLYAKWTAQPMLTSSKSDGKIYTGGRIILTANIGGGTWNYDNSFLSADFGSSASRAEDSGTGLSATFKALKAGTTRVTYTVEGQSTYYDVTIQQSNLPQTGQNFVFVYVLAGLACVAAVIALVIKKRVNGRDNL